MASLAIFTISLPRFFGLAGREQLLSANANLALSCHSETMESKILATLSGLQCLRKANACCLLLAVNQ
jgi:hypothetical protein